MRRLVIGLLVCLSSQSVWADDIKIENHKITTAVVYNDRASLTREAQIDIPAGSHNLVFKGIPTSIFTDSLRSKGSAAAKVVFGAVSHKRVSFEDYVVPKEQEIRTKIEALEDNRKIHSADKAALAAARTFLENIGKQASLREDEQIAKLELDPKGWGVAAKGIASELSENLKESLALDIKIRETDNKIRTLRSELGQLRTGQKHSYDVVIPYESDRATRLTVNLSYQIPNVGWTPIYDARLNTQTAQMELVQYGSVWQRTGEDWSDIELSLSTARPNRGTSQPDLHPKWVSILNQAHMRKSSMLKQQNFGSIAANISGAAMPSIAAYDMAAPEMVEEEVHIQSAHIETNGFVSEYKIKGPATVKSDGSQSKLLIGGFDTENTLQVQIKPQMSTDAYLVVKAKLQGDAPVLAGQVNLFRDGAFIGKSHLPMMRPDDVEELSFGIDDNVTVRRNILADKSSESGMISKEKTITKRFVTEVKNLHKTPVSIAVLETVPVSKDQRISVDLDPKHTTPGFEKDLHDVKGVYRWRADMKAGEELNINLGWSVTWPASENISGL